jgi:hypothetical protein
VSPPACSTTRNGATQVRHAQRVAKKAMTHNDADIDAKADNADAEANAMQTVANKHEDNDIDESNGVITATIGACEDKRGSDATVANDGGCCGCCRERQWEK